jgi:two-component system alkaline phosphatase synthesis response regulator PhoP
MAEKTALIIDDEPDITTYHGTVLADNGWQVQTANSGNEGLELAKQHKPDVVLLDVMMPERGGLSTLIGFRKDENLRDVPVVLVTGIQESLTQDFEKFLDRFKNYNPDGYVEKPIDPDKLVEMLDELIGARA